MRYPDQKVKDIEAFFEHRLNPVLKSLGDTGYNECYRVVLAEAKADAKAADKHKSESRDEPLTRRVAVKFVRHVYAYIGADNLPDASSYFHYTASKFAVFALCAGQRKEILRKIPFSAIEDVAGVL